MYQQDLSVGHIWCKNIISIIQVSVPLGYGATWLADRCLPFKISVVVSSSEDIPFLEGEITMPPKNNCPGKSVTPLW